MFNSPRRPAFTIIALAGSALAASCGLATIPAAMASAASAPATPFTQCPAIGAAPSCEILLVVNADNTVSVYGDKSVGPFDGSDDTLVGIVNDSTAAVKAVTVSGPGSGLSGFDSDGICGGAYGSWTGSSGCPYGSTGYEGPGTSFVTSPSLPDSAEVDFGAGLAPGKSAYFSLEGALTSAQLTAREGSLRQRYVALGDSYSSGEGDPPFLPGTDTKANQCHRSAQAYGPLMQKHLNITGSDFTFDACSGAILADFLTAFHGTGQYTDGAQLDAIAPAGSPSTDTGLITLSVGGNDAGFPDILHACIRGLGNYVSQNHCLSTMKSDLATATKFLQQGGTVLLDTKQNSYKSCNAICVAFWSNLDHLISGERYQVVTMPSLTRLYQDIHQRAPQAEIRVLQYPHLFPANPPAQCQVGELATPFHTFKYNIDQAEMTAANNAADSLDTIIANAVSGAQALGINIKAVDARPDFASHELCGSAPWINGLILTSSLIPSASPYSFHPNPAGQSDFAKLFEAGL